MPVSRLPFVIQDLVSEVRGLLPDGDQPTIVVMLEPRAYDTVSRELAHHAGITHKPVDTMQYNGVTLVRINGKGASEG